MLPTLKKLFAGIIFCSTLLIINSCKKEEPTPEPEPAPAALATVKTNPVTAITETSATSGGEVTAEGGSALTAVGVCWDTQPSPTTLKPHTTNGAGTGKYESKITGLTANTTYYVRAYATNGVGTAYGNELTFKSFGSFCDTITYNKHVKPIFDQNCVGCHGVNPTSGFDLDSYAKLKAKGEEGKIEARVILHTPTVMPPTGPLPQAQIDLISCWLKNGYKQ